MTGEETEPRKLYLRVLLGILPFDAATIIQFGSKLKKEAKETSWPSLFIRGVNVGFFLATIGILSTLLGLGTTIDMASLPFDNPGSLYIIATILVVGVMFLTFVFLKLFQSINKANSIVGQYSSSIRTGLVEYTLASTLLGILSWFFISVNTEELLIMVALSLVLIGIMISSVCLALSGTVNVFLSNKKD
jgi:hypothetical protein